MHGACNRQKELGARPEERRRHRSPDRDLVAEQRGVEM
jgi:hypothetical protein